MNRQITPLDFTLAVCLGARYYVEVVLQPRGGDWLEDRPDVSGPYPLWLAHLVFEYMIWRKSEVSWAMPRAKVYISTYDRGAWSYTLTQKICLVFWLALSALALWQDVLSGLLIPELLYLHYVVRSIKEWKLE